MNPNGCAECGRAKREHGQRWTPTAGWHFWIQPSEEQILARMKARRVVTVDINAGEGP